ncbi:hypothetical protein Mgra_00007584 [Meloidogyne graminicola]|uniref:Uncharacterized protein n=1 Tax=Meloidogyne graminicola TaxID=189291 RepID=A0A8S9ZI09_9BILA|nr:hypothetical protein Mgra_00007584 [Meloidogyne graminicola]
MSPKTSNASFTDWNQEEDLIEIELDHVNNESNSIVNDKEFTFPTTTSNFEVSRKQKQIINIQQPQHPKQEFHFNWDSIEPFKNQISKESPNKEKQQKSKHFRPRKINLSPNNNEFVTYLDKEDNNNLKTSSCGSCTIL